MCIYLTELLKYTRDQPEFVGTKPHYLPLVIIKRRTNDNLRGSDEVETRQKTYIWTNFVVEESRDRGRRRIQQSRGRTLN